METTIMGAILGFQIQAFGFRLPPALAELG